MLALVALFTTSVVALAQVHPSVEAVTVRPEDARSYRVLFVGNSYTRFHAMPLMVRAALRTLSHHPRVEVETVAHPGWTLERHRASGRPQRRIAHGHFTHVVLQGHSLSAMGDAAALREAVRALHAASRGAGARTVLYETWARREGAPQYRRDGAPLSPAEMTARIGEAYGTLAREIGSPVAPAGRAFAIAHDEHPEIELYRADGSHPSEAGSYLVACTVAGVVSGHDPRELRYVVPGLSRDRARALREIASRAIHAGP
jgi:hypothetical protein